jgi:ATP-dependent Clp protease adaptor protein ClpS
VADTLESIGLDTDEQLDQSLLTVPDRPWITIVWNDPVNLQNYVAWVFKSYFGFSPAEAQRKMLLVHNEGKAVVATGSREEMERHVTAMHGYGLWATLQKDDE